MGGLASLLSEADFPVSLSRILGCLLGFSGDLDRPLLDNVHLRNEIFGLGDMYYLAWYMENVTNA